MRDRRPKDADDVASSGSYVDYLFGVATGWLGWPPAAAWSATVPEIVVALDAKIEFIKMTNPFGNSKKDAKGTQKTMPSDDALKSMLLHASRTRSKK